MAEEESKVKGVVSDVGLERDEDQFRSFNIKIGVIVKGRRSLSYDDGERLVKKFRKDLLGKEVEVSAIISLCPVCGRGFNSEQGMKRHLKMAHKAKKKERKGSKDADEKGSKIESKGSGKSRKAKPGP